MLKFFKNLLKRKLPPIPEIERPRDARGRFVSYKPTIERAKLMRAGK